MTPEDIGRQRLPELGERTIDEMIPVWEMRALRTTWMGVQMIKSPFDAWVLQELLVGLRPELVIEIGCYRGGTAMFMGDVLDRCGEGEVITIDHRPQLIDPRVHEHERVTVVPGFALDVLDDMTARVERVAGPVIVIEDSSHTTANTLAVCEAYADLVTVGSYLIVEDTMVHGVGESADDPGPGPAVEAFLANDPRFRADPKLESFGVTFNPGGYLRRMR